MSKHENPEYIKGLRIDPTTIDIATPKSARLESPKSPADVAPPTSASRDAAPPQSPPTIPAAKSGRRGLAIRIVAALVAIAAIYESYDYFIVGRYLVSTDDAYLKADISIVSAKVAGYVTAVPVNDNTSVSVGDTVVAIDDGDYVNAVDTARAKAATQDATISRLGRQIDAQRAAVDQARAQIGSAQADLDRTTADLDRTSALAKSQYASIKTLDQARADQIKATQSVTVAQAALTAAEANLAVAQAQKVEAEHTKAELQTGLDKAERDLSFAVVKAPISGIVANRAAQIGDYVLTGTRLLAIVPESNVYVEANFKETQLAHMRPGQPATVRVDALGGATITGVVESLSPASGSLYSLLPPENATGNFTKIVQRFPVRIKLPADAIAKGGLRAGSSVVATIDTKPRDAGPAADTP